MFDAADASQTRTQKVLVFCKAFLEVDKEEEVSDGDMRVGFCVVDRGAPFPPPSYLEVTPPWVPLARLEYDLTPGWHMWTTAETDETWTSKPATILVPVYEQQTQVQLPVPPPPLQVQVPAPLQVPAAQVQAFTMDSRLNPGMPTLPQLEQLLFQQQLAMMATFGGIPRPFSFPEPPVKKTLAESPRMKQVMELSGCPNETEAQRTCWLNLVAKCTGAAFILDVLNGDASW